MTKTKSYIVIPFVVFIVSLLFRFKADQNKKITEDSLIRLSGRISSEQKLQDGRILVKIDDYSIIFNEYNVSQPLKYNDFLIVVGNAKVKVIGGFYQQISLINPEIIQIIANDDKNHFFGRKISIFLDQKVKKLFPEPHASLLSGVLLGINNRIGEDFYKLLKKTGTLHLVVASGGNIVFVLNAVMYLFLRIFTVNRKKALLISLLFILIYIAIVGIEPPIIRAGLMSVLAIFAAILGRQKSGLWFLFLASMIMLIINPLLLFSVSFQLSFFSTLGLMLLGPKFSNKNEKILGKVYSAAKGELRTTLAAFIFTAPVVWFNFQEFTAWGVLVNPLVGWTIPYIMILGTVTLVLSIISFPLAVAFQPFCFIFLEYFVKIIKIFA